MTDTEKRRELKAEGIRIKLSGEELDRVYRVWATTRNKQKAWDELFSVRKDRIKAKMESREKDEESRSSSDINKAYEYFKGRGYKVERLTDWKIGEVNLLEVLNGGRYSGVIEEKKTGEQVSYDVLLSVSNVKFWGTNNMVVIKTGVDIDSAMEEIDRLVVTPYEHNRDKDKYNLRLKKLYKEKGGSTAGMFICRDTGEEEVPEPEVVIRDNSNGGSDVRQFVQKNLKEIKASHEFTTVFIDTDKEYQKYGVSVPSVALICIDLSETIASLKKDPLVVKFNKSKTLRRVFEWRKGSFEGFTGKVWYTMYSSAKASHVNESEECCDLSYFGYINEDGTISVAPIVGDLVEIKGRRYPVVESIDCYVVQNGKYSFRLDESEINESIILDESTMDGQAIGSYTVIGMYGDSIVLADKNDFCYLYEASLDVKSEGVQQGALVLSINGKLYKYTSDQFSPNELEEKFNGIAKHSVGRALAWIKKNAVTQDSYRKSINESININEGSNTSLIGIGDYVRAKKLWEYIGDQCKVATEEDIWDYDVSHLDDMTLHICRESEDTYSLWQDMEIEGTTFKCSKNDLESVERAALKSPGVRKYLKLMAKDIDSYKVKKES